MQLSIIIVNYNVKYFLEQCLCSVLKAAATIQTEIIVVDNASSDGSIEYLLDKFPGASFIDNPKNLGFSKANNQGLAMARGKYILFLNPDTILAEDSLVKCLDFLETHAHAGACGVRMIDGTGRFLPESKRAFPTIRASFYKLSGLSSLFPRSASFAKYHMGHLSEFENAEVDILSGAFFMVKKSVLDVTEGFDEAFFMYGEDIDLSYRIQQAGYKNIYFAQTTIVHFKGESTKKGTRNYVKLFYSAMDIFVRKHYRKGRRAQLAVVIQLSLWFKAGLLTIKNVLSKHEVKAPHQPVRSMIIGSNVQYETIASILKKQAGQRTMIGLRWNDDWKRKIVDEKPDEIVFCEGGITYKEIMAGMQTLPREISFYLHGAGSACIVGSSSKNSSGRVMG